MRLLYRVLRWFGFPKQTSYKEMVVRVIPESEHRYDTMGDWWEDPQTHTWHIRVSQLGDWRKEFAVAIHEMIEMALCEYRGIPEQQVMDFDLSHPDSPQPGDEPDAPYRKEHQFATLIERQVATELGVDWESY